MKRKIALGSIIILIIILDIISINHIINANGVIQSQGANILLKDIDPIVNCTIFVTFFLIFGISYITLISEECEKIELKKIIIPIIVIAVLAGIALPNNSSDVYYYMAVGRLDSHYNSNPFEEIFINEQNKHLDDQIVASAPKLKVKFTYGALWKFICKVLSAIPITSTLVLLMLYKFVNVIIHMINCYLIYKISKKENKKRNILIYGLNPLIIFEGIINCHNDVFVILFILLAIYLKKKEKIGLAIGSIAMGALIKYVPVLVLPYILKDSKFKKILIYALEFLIIFVSLSFFIMGKASNLLVFLNQTKIYANSIYIIIYLIFNNQCNLKMINYLGKIVFGIIYLFWMYQLFLSDKIQKKIKRKENKDKNKSKNKNKIKNMIDEKIKYTKEHKEELYTNLMMLFLLLVITNFRTWYIMWIFAFIPILNTKMQNRIIALSLIAEISNIIMYLFGEGYMYGGYYFASVILIYLIYVKIQNRNQKKNRNKNNELTKEESQKI